MKEVISKMALKIPWLVLMTHYVKFWKTIGSFKIGGVYLITEWREVKHSRGLSLRSNITEWENIED